MTENPFNTLNEGDLPQSQLSLFKSYNPDVLNCLANLSNDEVFTPPRIAKRMLDLLPQELWHNPNATFLDPFCKSGVFLREITLRLNKGLANIIPDETARFNHILTQQVFGISITRLTSLIARRTLYCSKRANSELSACTAFDDEAGNIVYENTAHTWEGGRCAICGASEEVYGHVGDNKENHAYSFIHGKPLDLLKARFE